MRSNLTVLSLLLIAGTAMMALWTSASHADSTSAVASLPVIISPTNHLIRYVGRFDISESTGPRCSWSASEVELRFRGSGLNISLADTSSSDEFQVVVDGTPTSVITTNNPADLYNIYTGNSDAVHTIQLVKRTEAFFGVAQVQGFQLSKGGKVLSLPKPSNRRIEVIGDSISCGYGDLAPNQQAHFSATTEDAYLSYGAVAARALHAKYICIAWSGRLMWPTNTMSSVYGMTLPTITGSKWNFKQWIPQAVIINLSTNDFSPGIPAAKPWEDGYEAFIARVRKHYPNAIIYCTSSPMLWGDRNTVSRQYIHQIVTDEHNSGDKRVHFMDFQTQQASNGFGADWHPSVKTHAIMAAVIEQDLKRDLGW